MDVFTKLFGEFLVFVYHCFDRIVIHGYLTALSRPELVVHFFRDIVGVAEVSKEVLSQRTNDYQRWVEAYARNHSIPIEWAKKGVRTVPFADQESSGLEPDALSRRWPANCKGTSVPRLKGFVPRLAQAPQDRPIEIPECRGLDPIGEHAHQQPSRKMGGSDPAQMVSPLEAKLIHVEAGKAGDRGVELFAL